MRNVTLLGSRLVVGGYFAAHGAQKLFGSFDGPGLDRAAAGFEHLGLKPGKEMALLAGGTELVGGLLVATGVADPLGPLAIMGTMAVASTTHRARGPFTAKGGFELPLTNLAAAGALAVAGSGRFRLGPRAPRWTVRLAVIAGAVMAAYSIRQLLNKQPEPILPPAAVESEASPPSEDSEARSRMQGRDTVSA